MTYPFQEHSTSGNAYEYCNILTHRYPVYSGNLQPRRPPVPWLELYCNAVAFEKDSFLAQPLNGIGSISPLSIIYSSHSNFPHFLLIGDEEGVAYVRKTQWNSSKQGPVTYWKINQNAIFSMKFVPDDPNFRFITASGDRNLSLFDPRSETVLGTFDGHFASVKCFDFQCGKSDVFISGARDGHVLLWDSRVGNQDGSHSPVGYLVNAHNQPKPRQRLYQRRTFRTAPANHYINLVKFDKEFGVPSKSDNLQSISDILFQDQNVFITAGTADSSIKLWDLRKLSQTKPEAVHVIHLGPTNPYPFTSLCLDSSRTDLFAPCKDHTIYKFDVGPKKQAEPTARYFGADISSYYTKCTLSSDDKLLGCGSSDRNAFIFDVDNPNAAPAMLTGHTSLDVMSVAFCPQDPYQVATNGDDGKVLLWHAEPYFERNPQDIVGKAVQDMRGLEERTPKRRSRERIPPCLTVDPNSPSVSEWARVGQSNATSRETTPLPEPVEIRHVFRTPKRDPVQRQKRLRNGTLSPYVIRQSQRVSINSH